MSKTTHTPGPWIDIATHRGVSTVCCEGPSGGVICRCDTRKSEEENRANARLIAAAPELLAAAQTMLALLENLTTEKYSRGGDQPGRLALEAAIVNATGKPVS